MALASSAQIEAKIAAFVLDQIREYEGMKTATTGLDRHCGRERDFGLSFLHPTAKVVVGRIDQVRTRLASRESATALNRNRLRVPLANA